MTVKLYPSLSHLTEVLTHGLFKQNIDFFVNHTNYFLEKTVTIGVTWIELRKTCSKASLAGAPEMHKADFQTFLTYWSLLNSLLN